MARRRSRDPYRLLGVSRDATQDQLTLAYVEHTAHGGVPTRDIDLAYRLLWRERTRARYDRLYQASVRRMRLTTSLGAVSVLLLLVLGIGSGFWFASQDGNGASLRVAIPFVRPVPPPSSGISATQKPPLNPANMTLAAADLPAGYHLLSQGPASFSAASAASPQNRAAPPSWDVVFVRDAGPNSGRRLVESLAVIYSGANVARQALVQVGAAEAAQAATPQAPPPTLGSSARLWVESAPNGGPYTIVRLAWATGSVVSQVSVLDLNDPATVQQAVTLALAQQKHLVVSAA